MAVTFVGAGALAVSATAASRSPSTHANTLIGDILICQLINKSLTANTISPPDGTWTSIIAQGNVDASDTNGDFGHAAFWKRATADGAATHTFTKATDDNLLFACVISSWRGALSSGDPLDATTPVATDTTTAADDVSFPAFNPAVASHVVYMAYYGNDLTTFAAAMVANTNPACTVRYDLESGTGSDCTLACTSGDSDGSAIAARTWASVSTNDSGSRGLVFALVPQPETITIDKGDISLSASSITEIDGVGVTSLVTGGTPVGFMFLITASSGTSLSLSGSDIGSVEGDTIAVTAGSLTMTGSTITEQDIASVASASLSLSGGSVVTSDGEIIAIVKADLALSGSSVAESEGVGIANADLALSGQSIVTIDGEVIAKADLALSGSEIAETGGVGVTQSDLALSGQNIATAEGENIAITASSLTMMGSDFTEIDIVGIALGDIALASSDVAVTDTGTDAIIIDSSALTFASQNVTETGLISFINAEMMLTGIDIGLVDEGEAEAEPIPAGGFITRHRWRKLREEIERELAAAARAAAILKPAPRKAVRAAVKATEVAVRQIAKAPSPAELLAEVEAIVSSLQDAVQADLATKVIVNRAHNAERDARRLAREAALEAAERQDEEDAINALMLFS